MIFGCLVLASLCSPSNVGAVPELPQVVIYEANLRALGPKPGLRALTSRLGAIRSLGVNVLWLMPIQPIGKLRSAGGLGSPYAVADFGTVNPEFGSEADFQKLVSSAHRLRMAVILDWVADHTAWDNPWIKSHPDWYLHDAKGEISIPRGTEWKDVAALDYAQPSMRSAMVTAMKSWITRFGIDGFRCDAADRLPLDFWKGAIASLRGSTSKRLLMLAEGFRTDDYAAGFDLTYGWDFCTKLREVFDGKPATELADASSFEQKGLPAGARRLRFITNHDMSAWDGSTIDFYKTPEGERTAFTIDALYGGNPLIYTGQEVDWDRRIPIFAQSSIDWSRNPETSRWMGRLLRLRSEHPALKTGAVDDRSTKDVVLFIRTEGSDQALVLANVRNVAATVEIAPDLQGKWEDGETGLPANVATHVTLAPYTHAVFMRIHLKPKAL